MREFYEQGVKVSGSISNIINAYKRKHEQPLQSDTSGAEQASIITPRDGGPLSNFLTFVTHQPFTPLHMYIIYSAPEIYGYLFKTSLVLMSNITINQNVTINYALNRMHLAQQVLSR